MAVRRSRPSARTWVLATVELIAALTVARLIAWDDREFVRSVGYRDHGMPGMRGAAAVSRPYWGWVEYVAIGFAVAALVWLLLRRQGFAAVLAAAAVAVVVASPPVRQLATRSHLVAVVALELLLVVVPLLLLAAPRRRPDDSPSEPRGFRGVWTSCSAIRPRAALAATAMRFC